MTSGRYLVPVACACLTACSPTEKPTATAVEIPFAAQIDAQNVACGHDSGDFRMTDARFFIYQPRLTLPNGDTVAVDIHANDERWQQYPDLVLIDLEDGSGACVNGTPDTNAYIRGEIPAGDYRGLTFEIAVPFDRNHADPLAAMPPLDDSTMHWHWRSGYKFLRAGVETDDDGFWMHVGSAGCEGTVQNVTGCRYSNRSLVELPNFVLGQGVALDLSMLAGSVDLDDGVPSDCSSGPSEDECKLPFETLGIDFDSGETLATQSMFRVIE